MLYSEVLVVVILVLLNGFLAMSELALVSARKARLEAMARDGNKGAATALSLIGDPNRFLCTVQIGITLVGIIAGAYSGATLGERLGGWLSRFEFVGGYGYTAGIAIVVVSITYLSLIAGELVPKRIALANPERTAAFVAPPMRALSIAAAPAVWLLKLSIDAVLRVLGLNYTHGSQVSEDEIKSLIAEGTRAGVFVPQERQMIEGVLRLADRSVGTIMTPRVDMVWLDRNAPAEEVARIIGENRFSRFPVCDGSIDEVSGVVHVKDIVPPALISGTLSLKKYMTSAPFVPENKEVLRLLDRFKQDKVHVAIVVDEYGSTLGIVTLTDILEAIAGELPELGEEEGAAMRQRADGSWFVDGAMPVDEFAAVFGIETNARDYNTLAGFALSQFGHLPVAGESFEFGGWRFEVADMDGRRIDNLIVAPLGERTQESEGRGHGLA